MNKESFVLIDTATFSIQWSCKVFVKWLLYCHCWKTLCCFCSLVSGVAVCWAMCMGIMPALLLLYLKVFKLDKLSWPGNFRSYLFSLFGSTESCCFRVFTRSIVQSLHDPRYPGTRTSVALQVLYVCSCTFAVILTLSMTWDDLFCICVDEVDNGWQIFPFFF